MKVWLCETYETDGYDSWGEHVTVWHRKEDAEQHGAAVAKDISAADYAGYVGRFNVWEAEVQ